ncbi:MAG: AAA family ATPase [Candidatus Paracaedibacteraceae bacterium]|nr:AAA family ATPase [Candidatus Paracaedibacteraceae bacterium]
MIRATILFKLTILLMTSCLSSVSFSSSGLDGDDPFNGKENGGSDTPGTSFPKQATPDEYKDLFTALNKIVRIPITKVSEQQCINNAIDFQLNNFFETFKGENKTSSEANYFSWLILDALINEQETPDEPIWHPQFHNFISKTDSSAYDADKGNLKQKGTVKKAVKFDIDADASSVKSLRVPSFFGEKATAPQSVSTKLPTATRMTEHLKNFIIDQNDAMSSLSLYIHKHYASLKHNENKNNVHYDKSNILMIGHTGCGKTASVERISEFLKMNNIDIALTISSAASLTRTGYVGSSASSIIKAALMNNKHNVKATENSIIFIDEIDKIPDGKGIAGEDVQGELLRYLQGEVVRIEIDGAGCAKTTYEVNTTNILFICAGAFEGLVPDEIEVVTSVIEPKAQKPIESGQQIEISVNSIALISAEAKATSNAAVESALETITDTAVKAETDKKKKITYKGNEAYLAQYGIKSNLEKPTATTGNMTTPFPKKIKEKRYSVSDAKLSHWLKPEFIGRVHNQIIFKPMDKAGLRRILTEPKNSIIKQSISLLESEHYNINVIFTPKALDAIADKAFASQTGARSLKRIVDDVLKPTFRDADLLTGKTVTITGELVEFLIPTHLATLNQSILAMYV